MTKCPLCFKSLTPEVLSWMATTGPTHSDDAASRYYGTEQQKRAYFNQVRPADPRTKWMPQQSEAERALKSAVCEICPHCHYRLPVGWRAGQATCIAMAGSTATGKSVYIGVLVKALQLFAQRLGRVMDAANSTTEANYREHYERKLYLERGLLAGTLPVSAQGAYQRDPLVFRLGEWDGIPRFLVLRDFAGEDLKTDQHVGKPWTEFFGHADGVIFMFDPLKVPAIYDKLRDIVAPQERDEVPTLTVLRTVQSMIGPGNPNFAIALSKFDAMHELHAVDRTGWSPIMANPGAAFSRDPSLHQAFHDDDGQLIDAEMRSLLIKLDAKPIVNAAQSSHTGVVLRTRFFAISALGAMPAGEKIHRSGISPFRCVDPVRWILARNNVWVAAAPGRPSVGRWTRQ